MYLHESEEQIGLVVGRVGQVSVIGQLELVVPNQVVHILVHFPDHLLWKEEHCDISLVIMILDERQRRNQ